MDSLSALDEVARSRFLRERGVLDERMAELQKHWAGLAQVLAFGLEVPPVKVGHLWWLLIETAALHLQEGALCERYGVLHPAAGLRWQDRWKRLAKAEAVAREFCAEIEK